MRHSARRRSNHAVVHLCLDGKCLVLRGAVPVFVDIRPDTLNIDEKLIEQALSPKTRAIVPVHYAGVPCAMDEILEIARKNKLYVIEDAAQSLLSTYKDRFLGTIGHLGCLSFHETKNIISGEGGATPINDDMFCERGEVIREKGTNRSQFFRGEGTSIPGLISDLPTCRASWSTRFFLRRWSRLIR